MFLLAILGCGQPTVIYNNEYVTIYEVTVSESGDDTGWEINGPPDEIEPTVTPEGLAFDPFANDGAVYWFDVSESQVAQMNDDWANSWYDWYGPLYSVDEEGEGSTYADHLYVFDGANTADYGMVQVNVVGQSTGVTWTSTTIPNLSLDSNEFVNGQFFNFLERLDHLRLNNESVGSMIGEPLALSIWEAAGVSVQRFAYGFVGGTPWQNVELLIPYAMVETYKPAWCNLHADELGGGCAISGNGTATTSARETCRRSTRPDARSAADARPTG